MPLHKRSAKRLYLTDLQSAVTEQLRRHRGCPVPGSVNRAGDWENQGFDTPDFPKGVPSPPHRRMGNSAGQVKFLASLE
ncbi:hypothetical protein [Microseira wollei]|uniref:hypothetical protein n=1 Tax=Microseira wollei TaxID=467598 RepID=UPI001CFC9713|nr:hypothetical protein [Microseira wollei]